MAWKLDRIRFAANAPVWLASLCTEVERLRAENGREADECWQRGKELAAARDVATKALAQLDEAGARNVAALAEVALLKTTTFSENVAVVQKQLAAALAELKATKLSLANTEIELVDTLEDRRAALAECSRLRAFVNRSISEQVPQQLAAYEQLKIECERLRAELADCRREVEDWKEQAGHEL